MILAKALIKLFKRKVGMNFTFIFLHLHLRLKDNNFEYLSENKNDNVYYATTEK